MIKEKFIGKFMGFDLLIKTDEVVLEKAGEYLNKACKKMIEVEVDSELAKRAGIKTKTVAVSG